MKEVIILGAGLSGMITALRLASYGIHPTLLDKIDIAQTDFSEDNRTTALTNSSISFLKQIEIFDKLQPYLTPVKEVYVVDNNSSSELLQLSSGLFDNRIGFIIKNKDFKAIVATVVREKIDFSSMQYTDLISSTDHTTVVLEDGSINTGLLILCDGDFNRPIKNKYFHYRIEKQYHQKSVVFDVLHEKKHEHAALEHFLPSGPLATLPLDNQYKSNIVWSMDSKSFQIFQKLHDDERAKMLEKNTGYFLGQMRIINPNTSELNDGSDWISRNTYNLSAKIVEKYFHNRMVLVSDSAHILHPIAGQGFNQGIKDIDSLCWHLCISGINTQALVAYENQRKINNLFMYHLTNSINGIFSSQSLVLRGIRKSGMKFFSKCSYGKKLLLNYIDTL